jgi:hypothetical protein
MYLADNAVTTPKIADASVTTAKIAAGAVVTEDIANNAVTQAKLSTDIPLSGFRNELINGGFDVWQRWIATSINVSSGTTAYTADRWFMSPVGATMGAIRDTNVPPTSLSRYSLQIAPNGTGGSTCNLGQRIEASNVYALKGTVTFSAWIFNNTTASITPVLLLGTPSAEDNFTTVTNRLTQSLQACANGAWTKVTHTVDISGYTNINNGLQLEIQTSGHTTFGRIVRIAEVQLERNTQATPFEQRPIGVELALCQRYFWKLISNGISYLSFQYAGTQYRLTIPHPVQMRVNPHTVSTSTWQGGTTPSLGAASVLSTNWSTTGGWFYVDGSTSIEISAEL